MVAPHIRGHICRPALAALREASSSLLCGKFYADHLTCHQANEETHA